MIIPIGKNGGSAQPCGMNAEKHKIALSPGGHAGLRRLPYDEISIRSCLAPSSGMLLPYGSEPMDILLCDIFQQVWMGLDLGICGRGLSYRLSLLLLHSPAEAAATDVCEAARAGIPGEIPRGP